MVLSDCAPCGKRDTYAWYGRFCGLVLMPYEDGVSWKRDGLYGKPFSASISWLPAAFTISAEPVTLCHITFQLSHLSGLEPPVDGAP